MSCQAVSPISDPEVLVVGGGPVGMLCAAELAAFGVRTLLVEPRMKADWRPRAGTVHSRTLSLLARRGYLPAGDATDDGAEVTVNFQFAGEPVLRITAPAVEPGPIAGIPQGRLEELFENAAITRGAEVSRGVRAVAADEVGQGMRVVLQYDSGAEETVQAKWVIGADGPRGLVARQADFRKVEYPPTMHAISGLASVPAGEQLPHGWHKTPTGWLMTNPNPGASWRIIPMDFSGPGPRTDPTVDEYLELMRSVLGRPIQLSDVRGLTRFSDYGRYHRSMREGRLMIVGDAAHVHYPLGGQGMNMGIHDAVSLCWRLAAVVRGDSRERVLDDFSRERTAVAADVVANTVLQAQMMAPQRPQLARAVHHLMGGGDLQRIFGDMVSQQRQPVPFQPDLAIRTSDRQQTTLIRLLQEGSHVALRRADARGIDTLHALGTLPKGTRVVVGDFSPEPEWQAVLVRPDGYVDRVA